MSYGSRLTEAVQLWKPRVEEYTETDLGDVVVQPYTYVQNPVTATVKVAAGLIAGLTSFNYAHIDDREIPPTIYFNSNPLLSIIPYLPIDFIATHELGHLAHRTAATPEKFNALQSDDREFIADYIADSLTKKHGIMKNYIRHSYRSIFVQERLNSLGISLPQYLQKGVPFGQEF